MEIKEILCGTKKEIEDYFYNTLKIEKYGVHSYKTENEYYMEMGSQTISTQLDRAEKEPKSIGMIVYFRFERQSDSEAVMIAESKFVFIRDEEVEEKLREMYKK